MSNPITAAWQLFRPIPVLMISTLDRSGFTRCSPFSWVVPLNKEATFGISIRRQSGTLFNLRAASPYFTMSWVRPLKEDAQDVVMASKKGFNSIDLTEIFKTRFKVPENALAVAEAKLLKLHKLADPPTHFFAVCELLSWQLLSPEEDFVPLVHLGFKTFGITQRFDVEGY